MRILNRNGSKSPHSRASHSGLSEQEKQVKWGLKRKKMSCAVCWLKCDLFRIHQLTSVVRKGLFLSGSGDKTGSGRSASTWMRAKPQECYWSLRNREDDRRRQDVLRHPSPIELPASNTWSQLDFFRSEEVSWVRAEVLVFWSWGWSLGMSSIIGR